MKRLLAFIFSLLLTGPMYAGSKTGADFLKIPIGAEALGLGQAYTAMANGINSLNWNPAGIAKMPGFVGGAKAGFSYSHQELLLGSNLDQVGIALPSTFRLKPLTMGISILRLENPTQEGRDENRNPTGGFRSSDLALGGALTYNFGGVQLGTQVKYIRQELAEFTAQGMAVDLGFLSKSPINKLSLGGSVRNLGPKMKFISEEFNLPLTLSVGAAYNVTGPLTVGLDLYSRPYQDEVSLAIGTEIAALNSITLRAGYLAKLAETVVNSQESETNRGNISGLDGLNAGVGLNLKTVSLDYAISQFGELGITHSLTLATYFGGQPTTDSTVPLFSFHDEIEVQNRVIADPERVIVIFAQESVQETPWWTTAR